MNDAFSFRISQGLVPGVSAGYAFGENLGVGTAFEPVTVDGIVSTTIFPSTPSRVKAVSASANDTVSGTGAQMLMIRGVDENWNDRTEPIMMNGTSDTSLSCCRYFRVHSVWIERVGAYSGNNDGQIDIQNESSTVILSMAVNTGTSQHAALTVPKGHAFHMNKMHVQVESTKLVDLRICFRRNAHMTGQNYGAVTDLHDVLTVDNNGNVIEVWATDGLYMPEYTDIWAEAKVSTGTARASISLFWRDVDIKKFDDAREVELQNTRLNNPNLFSRQPLP